MNCCTWVIQLRGLFPEWVAERRKKSKPKKLESFREKNELRCNCDSKKNYEMRHSRQKWQDYSLFCTHFVLDDAPHWWCFSRWPWILGSELIMGARVTPTASDRLTQWLPTEMSCVWSMICRCVCVCVCVAVHCGDAARWLALLSQFNGRHGVDASAQYASLHYWPLCCQMSTGGQLLLQPLHCMKKRVQNKCHWSVPREKWQWTIVLSEFNAEVIISFWLSEAKQERHGCVRAFIFWQRVSNQAWRSRNLTIFSFFIFCNVVWLTCFGFSWFHPRLFLFVYFFALVCWSNSPKWSLRTPCFIDSK